MILRTDLIECPGCGNVFDADITQEDGDPWPTYMATCPVCEYEILESEWELAEQP